MSQLVTYGCVAFSRNISQDISNNNILPNRVGCFQAASHSERDYSLDSCTPCKVLPSDGEILGLIEDISVKE